MPDEGEHIDQALHNIHTANYLFAKPDFYDWVVCVLFYSALHIVDAVLFRDQQQDRSRHGGTHDRREDILKHTHRYEQIYRHYSPLSRASHVARYLQERKSDQVTLFKDYMPNDMVKSEVIRGHFWQIIKAAGNFLTNSYAVSLEQTFSESFNDQTE